MGSLNSKSTSHQNYSNLSSTKSTNRFTYFPCRQAILSSCTNRNESSSSSSLSLTKRRLCLKKKVLLLGFDGVGKTELFQHLISTDKHEQKIDTFPRPTLGYNVETMRIRCHHLCHRQYHKLTLWDCGGQSLARSQWSYHYPNTSLLVWMINSHDRSRLDANLHLLSQVLLNPLLFQIPLLIIIYKSSFHKYQQDQQDEEKNQNLLTNLEVAFRFLATLSTSHASSFKWQVINVSSDQQNLTNDLKKVRQSFRELMDL